MAYKGYKVVWTNAALLDLEGIYNYITQEVSETKALQVIDEIYMQASSLRNFPKHLKRTFTSQSLNFAFCWFIITKSIIKYQKAQYLLLR